MMAAEIKKLIVETWGWHDTHMAAGRRIEALAAIIRLQALEQALKIVEKHSAE